MVSKISASNVENHQFIKDSCRRKNPEGLINKFQEVINSANANDVDTIKAEIKNIIVYITALLHTNYDNPTLDYSTADMQCDLSEDGLLKIADQLAKHIAKKFNLDSSTFSKEDCMKMLHLCMHQNRNFEFIVHDNSRFTNSVKQLFMGLGIDPNTDDLKQMKRVIIDIDNTATTQLDFGLLRALNFTGFINSEIELSDGYSYGGVCFSGDYVTTITLTDQANICGADLSRVHINNPGLITDCIKNTFDYTFNSFKSWVFTINSLSDDYNDIKPNLFFFLTQTFIDVKIELIDISVPNINRATRRGDILHALEDIPITFHNNQLQTIIECLKHMQTSITQNGLLSLLQNLDKRNIQLTDVQRRFLDNYTQWVVIKSPKLVQDITPEELSSLDESYEIIDGATILHHGYETFVGDDYSNMHQTLIRRY